MRTQVGNVHFVFHLKRASDRKTLGGRNGAPCYGSHGKTGKIWSKIRPWIWEVKSISTPESTWFFLHSHLSPRQINHFWQKWNRKKIFSSLTWRWGFEGARIRWTATALELRIARLKKIIQKGFCSPYEWEVNLGPRLREWRSFQFHSLRFYFFNLDLITFWIFDW